MANLVLASLFIIAVIVYFIKYLEILMLANIVITITISPAKKETPINSNIIYMAMPIYNGNRPTAATYMPLNYNLAASTVIRVTTDPTE